MTLRLDRQGDGSDDGQDAGGDTDALPEPLVVIVRRSIRQAQQTQDQAAHGSHRPIIPATPLKSSATSSTQTSV